MAQLVDHNGNPISTALLKNEVATAAPWGVRKVTSSTVLTGLDPAKLANILRAAEMGDARAYLELAEEMEEKYLHYAGQLGTRKRAVCGVEWQVTPATDKLRDRKIADYVALVIPALKAFTFDALDALGKGYSVGELMWDTSDGQWMIKKIEHRDPRWFQYDRIDGRTLKIRSDTNIYGDPLTPGKFMVIQIAAKSGLPIRGGLARAACWAHLFCNFSLRDWVTFCEMFGIPLRLGRYDAGSATAADLEILFQAVRDIGMDGAAMIPKSMEIEFPTVQAGRAGADLWERLLEYMDRQVSKLVLGQTLTADSGQRGGGGSYALGNVHNEVRFDILDADATALALMATDQVVKTLVDLNFAGVTAYPTLSLPVEEPQDQVALAGIVDKAVRMGQPVGVNWVSKKFNIPLPQEGEATLKPLPGSAAGTAQDRTTAVQRAAHAAKATKSTPDTADHLQPFLAANADALVSEWISDLEAMLQTADSLENYNRLVMTRFADLPKDQLVNVMAMAFALIELRGRTEVQAGE